MSEAELSIDYQWSKFAIEELVRNGVDHFFICPGSRSTPLTVAVALNPKTTSIICIDERAAAFAALGFGRARKKAAAVITTSGSAVANLYPAIVESSQALVPVILLSADRPIELRQATSNQTIDQVKMFSSFCRFEISLPAPGTGSSFDALLTTIDQAVSKAHLPSEEGPSFLNFAFREPFLRQGNAPAHSNRITQWLSTDKSFTRRLTGHRNLDQDDIETIEELVKKSKQVLLMISGPLSSEDKTAVAYLAEKTGWPLACDITSAAIESTNLLHHLDLSLLNTRLQYDLIICFGSRPVSKRFLQLTSETPTIIVNESTERADPGHSQRIQVTTSISGLARALAEKNTMPHENLKEILSLDRSIAAAVAKADGIEIETLTWLCSQPVNLCISNSMPIRDAEMFGRKDRARVFSSRGASGIDGNIASAAGTAIGLHEPVTLVTGDLALLHDLNSLGILKNSKYPVTVIVLNNRGGTIFTFLDIYQSQREIFDRFFAAEHEMSFSHAAAQFSLEYSMVETLDELKNAVIRHKGSHSLIEVKSNREENLHHHKKIFEKIKELP